MATIAEQLTSLANTKTAIKEAIVAKGVQVADTDTFASYATKIGEIQSGGGEVVDKTKFGVSIDDMFLTSLSNMVDREFEFDATSIESLSTKTKTVDGETLYLQDPFAYKFYNNLALVGTVDLSGYKGQTYMAKTFEYAFSGSCIEKFICPSHTASFEGQLNLPNCCENCPVLKTVVITSTRLGDTNVQLRSSFKNCKKLATVEGIENVEEVAYYGLYYAFEGCTALQTLDVSNIKSIGNYGMMRCFYGCTSLTGDFVFASLESLGDAAFQYAFQGCTSPLRFFFPALTTINARAMGSTATNSAFRNATGVTEIHFRADMQSTIESLSQYSSKWGATNATIYFDL